MGRQHTGVWLRVDRVRQQPDDPARTGDGLSTVARPVTAGVAGPCA